MFFLRWLSMLGTSSRLSHEDDPPEEDEECLEPIDWECEDPTQWE
jgi:hypothetical protein